MKTGTERFLWTVSAFLICAVCACGPSGAVPTLYPTVLPTPAPSPTIQRIDALDPSGQDVHLWHSFSGAKEAALRDLAAKFEAQNSYRIRLRVESHSRLDQEVLTSMSAGTPPDLVVGACDQIAEYALSDAVVPLSDYINNAKYGLSQAEHADLWPIALQAACLPVGEKQPLGVLVDAQAVVMLYNTKWLKKLKFDEPPPDWDAFGKACSAARDRKAGTWGGALALDGPTLVNWIAGLGGTLVSPSSSGSAKTGRQAVLDSAEAIAALSWLADSLEKGYVYYVSEAGGERADFAAEKALFTFGSTDELPAYTEAIVSPKTKKPRFEWAVAPLPHLTSQPMVGVQGSVVSVLRTTPRQQLAAWLFLRWLLQPENDAQWALATGGLLLHKSSQDLPQVQAYFAQNPQYKTACQLLAYAQAEPAVPKWQDMRALLVDAAAAVCENKANPADALASADAAADMLSVR